MNLVCNPLYGGRIPFYMIKITASINFWGMNFKPTRVEQETGLIFTKKKEIGSIGANSRYKNQPLPYGSAQFEAPETIEWDKQVLWLANKWIGKINIARLHGAEDVHFWIGYFYDTQCNCELSVEEIKAINELGIPYLFSVYQVDNPGEIS